MEKMIQQAAEVIANADSLIITAGAGIGVDSGLPDFRGTEGFWVAYPPLAKLGISFIEMANPKWFKKRPHLAWAFYGHRLNMYRRVVPHEGYQTLLKMTENKPGGYFVFTSNVDGHFQKAGFDEMLIEECHGSINHLQCSQPCSDKIWTADDLTVQVDETTFEAAEPLPHCKHCAAIARPNILMFGDWQWNPDRSQEQAVRFDIWLKNNRRKGYKTAIIELGAGVAVATVRYKSEMLIESEKATLIRINPQHNTVPKNHISIATGAKEGLTRIYNYLQNK